MVMPDAFSLTHLELIVALTAGTSLTGGLPVAFLPGLGA